MTGRSAREIRVAFSPDSDDIFMFWALLHGKVRDAGLTFVYERADTETLNRRADRGDVDVLAVSIARYPSIAARYRLLSHGMSVGRGYGPVLVAREGAELASFAGKRIGIPGERTTAALVLRLLLPRFEAVVVPIAPYAQTFQALRSGMVDAALVIHEGRLTYAREGFFQVVDLGEAWSRLTGGLPLPLGGNVVRRALGDEAVARVSAACRASIGWALDHREEVVADLLTRETRADVALDRAMLDRYLRMYANDDTREAPEDVRRAVVELYARARAAKLFHREVLVDFAP
jgi:1,4-dihydroxy-6-naphthoate synthase